MSRLVAVGEGFTPREVRLTTLGQGVMLGRCPLKSQFQAERIAFQTNETKILALSRNHCSIEYDSASSGKFHVVDQGGNNGVFIDGVLLEKFSTSAGLVHGSVIRLTKAVEPCVSYRFEQEEVRVDKEEAAAAAATHTEELAALLECAGCKQMLTPPVACLPCGHCFCAQTCVRGKACLLCQTSTGSQGAFRCVPLDRVLTQLFHRRASSVATRVFASVDEDDGDALASSSSKRQRLEEDEEEQAPMCEFCAEPKHEPGMRCPHRPDTTTTITGDDEEDSDLEQYV